MYLLGANEMFDLNGKTALVTGGAGGIGRETAAALAQQGAKVFVSDISPDEIDTSIGTPIKHDVTSQEDWNATVDVINSQSGRLDILVNNAGIILNRPFLMTSIEDFRRVHEINVESVWMGMQACAALMTKSAKEGGDASIINLSSIYGLVAGPMHAAYCASKGAVRLLTKATALEFARSQSGIRVNSVHPGPVETPLGLSGVEDAVALGALENAEQGKAAVAANFPMGRWGRVDDISGVITFLASDAAKFVTGAEITVDGGMTIT